MKTLVIHPYDYTTRFLSVIYEGKDWTVITDTQFPKSKLKKAIQEHDRIICLGHGTEHGLIAMQSKWSWRQMIDSTLVYLLREKELVFVWCNADEFAKKYDLKGFITGMIISEDEEANMFSVNATEGEIYDSNVLFSKAVADSIDLPPHEMMENGLEIYKGDSDIIAFNRENFNVFD